MPHNMANIQQHCKSWRESGSNLCAAFSQRAAALCSAVAANSHVASASRSAVAALVTAVTNNHLVASGYPGAVAAHNPAVAGRVLLFSSTFPKQTAS